VSLLLSPPRGGLGRREEDSLPVGGRRFPKTYFRTKGGKGIYGHREFRATNGKREFSSFGAAERHTEVRGISKRGGKEEKKQKTTWWILLSKTASEKRWPGAQSIPGGTGGLWGVRTWTIVSRKKNQKGRGL